MYFSTETFHVGKCETFINSFFVMYFSVESHISNKNIPLFTLENEEQKILCLGIFLADHQILFRATCIPKLPRKLKGLYARAYSGMRYSAVSLWVRRGYTGVGEDENEYAILYVRNFTSY